METVKNNPKHPLYKPATLSFIATVTNVFAWLSLGIAIFYAITDLTMLDENFLPFGFSNGGHWWEWQNLTSWIVLDEVIFPIISSIIPLVGTFFLLKCVSIGINVLLEIDFSMKTEIKIKQDVKSDKANSKTDEENEDQPAFYAPEKLSSFASIASKAAWIFLCVSAGIAVWQFFGNLATSSPMSIPVWYLFVNLLTKLTTAGISFFMLKGFSIGLNVLMEFEYNSRGVK